MKNINLMNIISYTKLISYKDNRNGTPLIRVALYNFKSKKFPKVKEVRKSVQHLNKLMKFVYISIQNSLTINDFPFLTFNVNQALRYYTLYLQDTSFDLAKLQKSQSFFKNFKLLINVGLLKPYESVQKPQKLLEYHQQLQKYNNKLERMMTGNAIIGVDTDEFGNIDFPMTSSKYIPPVLSKSEKHKLESKVITSRIKLGILSLKNTPKLEFSARYIRSGKSNTGGNTIMLKDLKYHNKEVAQHVWLVKNENPNIKGIKFKHNSIIRFSALIKSYWKNTNQLIPFFDYKLVNTKIINL